MYSQAFLTLIFLLSFSVPSLSMLRVMNVVPQHEIAQSVKQKKSPQGSDLNTFLALSSLQIQLGLSVEKAKRKSSKLPHEEQHKQHKALDQEQHRQCILPHEEQRKKYYAELLATPWGDVSKKYIEALDAEEKELMKEFFELTGVTQQQLDGVKMACMANIEKDTANRYQEILAKNSAYQESVIDGYKERVIAFLDYHGLQHIKIVVNAEMHCSSVYMGIYCIGIDHLKYDDLSSNRLKSASAQTGWNSNGWDLVILHEIMHLLQSDSLINACIRHFSANSKFELKYSRFVEKRADILAGLSGPLVTLGIRAQYGEKSRSLPATAPQWIKKVTSIIERPEVAITHPKNDDRIDYLNQLHQEMLEAIEKNKQKAK